MIILYIPFLRSEAGDLTNLVELWKMSHQRSTAEPLIIIYHNDDYDQEVISSGTSLYICAHGYENCSLHVYNNSDPEKASFLHIADLAKQFNNDFLPIAHRLSIIHMYFCGSEYKNRCITQQFKQNLLRPDCPIVFYNGTITIPDAFGQRWSLGQGKKVPIDATAVYSFCATDKDDEPIPKYIPLKEQYSGTWIEEARAQRHYQFFDRLEKARESLLAKKRALVKEDCISVKPS